MTLLFILLKTRANISRACKGRKTTQHITCCRVPYRLMVSSISSSGSNWLVIVCRCICLFVAADADAVRITDNVACLMPTIYWLCGVAHTKVQTHTRAHEFCHPFGRYCPFNWPSYCCQSAVHCCSCIALHVSSTICVQLSLCGWDAQIEMMCK